MNTIIRRACVGGISANADPATVRSLLLTYYELLDRCRQLRTQHQVEGASLRERLAGAFVQEELLSKIAAARAWLSNVAEHGGRGLPPPVARHRACPDTGAAGGESASAGWRRAAAGADRGHQAVDGLLEPLAASMGHGWPALDPGGRTRAQEASGASIAVPADLLFSASRWQDLPPGEGVDHAQTQTGGHSCV